MRLSFLLLTAATALLVSTAAAIPPPDDVAEINLKSSLIAIGEVSGAGAKDAASSFTLKIEHLIKGYELAKTGANITVLSRQEAEKNDTISRQVQGVLPVKVTPGTMVIVYLDSIPGQPGIFKPHLMGLSVVTIGMPLKKK